MKVNRERVARTMYAFVLGFFVSITAGVIPWDWWNDRTGGWRWHLFAPYAWIYVTLASLLVAALAALVVYGHHRWGGKIER